MRLHREGKTIMTIAFLLMAGIIIGSFVYLPPAAFLILSLLSIVLFLLVVQFFRVPFRQVNQGSSLVVCPADGKVVVIEETEETEYFNDRRIQVSIFMSPLNVHVNWYPVSGIVKYFKYHKGKYLVAWHPKSSIDNERTTVVVENHLSQEVLFRQIAGAMARRIVCYARKDDVAQQGSEFGFIKFGSRVDIFLPLGSKVIVERDQKVKGSETILAELPTESLSAPIAP